MSSARRGGGRIDLNGTTMSATGDGSGCIHQRHGRRSQRYGVRQNHRGRRGLQHRQPRRRSLQWFVPGFPGGGTMTLTNSTITTSGFEAFGVDRRWRTTTVQPAGPSDLRGFRPRHPYARLPERASPSTAPRSRPPENGFDDLLGRDGSSMTRPTSASRPPAQPTRQGTTPSAFSTGARRAGSFRVQVRHTTNSTILTHGRLMH